MALTFGEIPPMSDEERKEKADHIVIGVPFESVVEERRDENYIYRTMTFKVRVEEPEKGGLVRGDLVEIQVWKSEWIGEGRAFSNATGHRPLPVEGELTRFHLAEPNEKGRYPVLIPNGVERGDRTVDPPPSKGDDTDIVSDSEPDGDPKETISKDPFGWDVILVLLAVPVLIGSFRQSGTSRWVPMSVATVMLVAALLTALAG